MKDNQLIHERVMGGKRHFIKEDAAGDLVCDCGGYLDVFDATEAEYNQFYLNHKNLDYSDPTNYEALSSKFREWGEWQLFGEHLSDLLLLGKLDEPFDLFCWWYEHDTQGKIVFLADYIRSKCVEYWDIRRKE